MKTKFIMLGCGWRAEFYLKAAKVLSDKLEVSAIVMGSEERAKQIQEKTGIFSTADLETALDRGADFAFVCLPREMMAPWIIKLMERQIPVLCETPPGKNVEELNLLWKEKERLNGRVQVAEQYFLQPYYRSVQHIIDTGIIGTVSNVNLSALHGYHAISIFRKFLGMGCENCIISGRRFSFPVTKTRDREGWHQTGEVLHLKRDRAELCFENGKVAFFDFDDEHYFSPIRSTSCTVQGERGEIRDRNVCYMDKENRPVKGAMHREDNGVYGNDGWSHMYMGFEGKRIYENPFAGARLNDDELAVTDVLAHMKRYVETGEDFYPLREGLQDAYLDFTMAEAIETGKAVETEKQSWAE